MMEEKREKEKPEVNEKRTLCTSAAIHFTNECLTDAAKSIFDIAIRWELGNGAWGENPAMEVADAMLRQIRALRQQHHMNERDLADPESWSRCELPPAVRNIWSAVSRERRTEAEK